MMAALSAKQDADAVAMTNELADIAKAEERAAAIAANEAEIAAREAEAQAKAKARGEAIGGFFANVGSAIGGTLGFGKNDAPAEPEAPRVVNPSLVAPIPAPRISRS